MIEIYALRVPEHLTEEQYFNLLSIVQIDKRQRVVRYLNPVDRYRVLLADILVRYIVANLCNIDFGAIEFTTTIYGKPLLRNVNGINFNVSHSGDWIVGIFHSNPVGIDIEKIEPVDFNVSKLFSNVERGLLLKKKGEKRIEYFYDLWTLKESFLKACGKGLHIPLNTFTIKKECEHITIEQDFDNVSYYFKQYCFDELYKLSACATVNQIPYSVKLIDFSTMYCKIYPS